MNTKIKSLLAVLITALFLSCFAYAQDSVPLPADTTDVSGSPAPEVSSTLEPTILDAVIATLPESVQSVANAIVSKVSPSVINFILTFLFYYGTFSVGWQALWGWVDKRTASTTSDHDDKLAAKLKNNAVFKVLDKIAYFGEKVGSTLGKLKK